MVSRIRVNESNLNGYLPGIEGRNFVSKIQFSSNFHSRRSIQQNQPV